MKIEGFIEEVEPMGLKRIVTLSDGSIESSLSRLSSFNLVISSSLLSLSVSL